MTPRERLILNSLMLAVEIDGAGTWDQIVTNALRYGTAFRPPLRRDEIAALYDVPVGRFFEEKA